MCVWRAGVFKCVRWMRYLLRAFSIWHLPFAVARMWFVEWILVVVCFSICCHRKKSNRTVTVASLTNHLIKTVHYIPIAPQYHVMMNRFLCCIARSYDARTFRFFRLVFFGFQLWIEWEITKFAYYQLCQHAPIYTIKFACCNQTWAIYAQEKKKDKTKKKQWNQYES